MVIPLVFLDGVNVKGIKLYELENIEIVR